MGDYTVIPFCVILFPVMCAAEELPVQNLLISGDDAQPGIIGKYPDMSSFSWMNHIVSAGTDGFSWQLSAGEDGGILFGRPQPSNNQLVDVRTVYNAPTTYISVDNGIQIDSSGTIDMSTIRMKYDGNQIDIAANAPNVLIPLVADISSLAAGQNGWVLNADGSYHIIFHSTAICTGCALTLHFTGQRLDADGDIDDDGDTDVVDLMLSRRAVHGLLNLDALQLLHADVAPVVDGTPQPDGLVDSRDMLQILQKVLVPD